MGDPDALAVQLLVLVLLFGLAWAADLRQKRP